MGGPKGFSIERPQSRTRKIWRLTNEDVSTIRQFLAEGELRIGSLNPNVRRDRVNELFEKDDQLL
jgi:hypothetical protein